MSTHTRADGPDQALLIAQLAQAIDTGRARALGPDAGEVTVERKGTRVEAHGRGHTRAGAPGEVLASAVAASDVARQAEEPGSAVWAALAEIPGREEACAFALAWREARTPGLGEEVEATVAGLEPEWTWTGDGAQTRGVQITAGVGAKAAVIAHISEGAMSAAVERAHTRHLVNRWRAVQDTGQGRARFALTLAHEDAIAHAMVGALNEGPCQAKITSYNAAHGLRAEGGGAAHIEIHTTHERVARDLERAELTRVMLDTLSHQRADGTQAGAGAATCPYTSAGAPGLSIVVWTSEGAGRPTPGQVRATLGRLESARWLHEGQLDETLREQRIDRQNEPRWVWAGCVRRADERERWSNPEAIMALIERTGNATKERATEH